MMNMKRKGSRAILLGILLGVSSCCWAQEKDSLLLCHEVSFGVGYSKVGAGTLVGIEDKVEAVPMFNISPVGIEFGNKKWRGFTELLPMGTLGVFNGGIKYSF